MVVLLSPGQPPAQSFFNWFFRGNAVETMLALAVLPRGEKNPPFFSF
jgi:hypothetical protein